MEKPPKGEWKDSKQKVGHLKNSQKEGIGLEAA